MLCTNLRIIFYQVFVIQDEDLITQHFPDLCKEEQDFGSFLPQHVAESEVLILVSKPSQPLVSDVVSKMYGGADLTQVLENVMSEYNEPVYTGAMIYSTMSINLGVKGQESKTSKEELNSDEANSCVLL